MSLSERYTVVRRITHVADLSANVDARHFTRYHYLRNVQRLVLTSTHS